MFLVCFIPKSPPCTPQHRQAIDLNKTVLARIVAGLFTLLGLTQGAVLGRIPIELHRKIRRVLRPAESAARRLIVVLAMFVKVNSARAYARPMPAGIVRTGQKKSRPTFQLFEPRQRFFQKRARPKAAGAGPRVRSFGDTPYRAIAYAPAPKPPSDGLENAAHLVGRLHALKSALEDLPRQANRLARVLAQRQNSPDWKVKLKTPLRPGRPPGHRQKPRQEIDGVLRECEWLARNVLPPDTS